MIISLVAGDSLSVSTSQSLATSSASLWYNFTRSSGEQFLVLGTDSQTVLYGFRGVFIPVQILAANGSSGFTAFSPRFGEDIFIAVDGGSEGNREMQSYVYRFTDNETVSLVCQQ